MKAEIVRNTVALNLRLFAKSKMDFGIVTIRFRSWPLTPIAHRIDFSADTVYRNAVILIYSDNEKTGRLHGQRVEYKECR